MPAADGPSHWKARSTHEGQCLWQARSEWHTSLRHHQLCSLVVRVQVREQVHVCMYVYVGLFVCVCVCMCVCMCVCVCVCVPVRVHQSLKCAVRRGFWSNKVFRVSQTDVVYKGWSTRRASLNVFCKHTRRMWKYDQGAPFQLTGVCLGRASGYYNCLPIRMR